MGKKYGREEIIELLEQYTKRIEELYKASFVNWSGENEKYYTEIIAEELLNNNFVEKLKDIPQIERKKYKIHKKHYFDDESNRAEEYLAKKICLNGHIITGLGEVFEYQIPLKDCRDTKAGKIDLISYDKDNNDAYLIELKYADNKETLLRSILEISTYHQLLNKEAFIETYKGNLGNNNPNIKKAVLLVDNCQSAKEAADINNRKSLKELSNKLEVDILTLNYEISELKARKVIK